jgi:hypothetical protein
MHFSKTLLSGLLAASGCAWSCAYAAPPPDWVAVDVEQLAQMRGGFTADNGLKISFGVERNISINGEVLSTTGFNSGNLGKLAAGQATLIQNGPGNVFQPGQLSSSSAAATFIQNSLNDQTIRSITVVNAATNSLEFLKGINLQSSLNQALSNAVAPH